MKKSTLSFTALAASTIFFMSATQCAKPAQEGRVLAKNVRIGKLSATTAMDESGFNFSEVARAQVSGVLFDKGFFFERNSYPNQTDLQIPDNKYYNVKSASVQGIAVHPLVAQIKKWFPEAKAQDMGGFSHESACLISRPQHYLYGSINALEAYSGTSLVLKLVAGIPLPVSGQFQMDKMRMDLSFKAVNPWTNETVAASNSEAFKTDYKVGFGIDFGGLIHIGPEFYRHVGMAELTLKGLKQSVIDLAQMLFSKDEVWQTRVAYSGDNNVVIIGGKELGLKPGDQLKVYNEIHTWNGTPCAADAVLTGSVVVTDQKDPWIIEILDAGDLASSARVLNPKENTSIEVGALVKLHLFTEQVQAAAAAAANAKPTNPQKP